MGARENSRDRGERDEGGRDDERLRTRTTTHTHRA